MSKDKFKKIPISEFISDKKLSKIMSIIEKSDDVETNYDRIEMLLDEDYEVKDLGTNRLVLLHKKNKYKNLIFKVAGDSHGIEANYREFYNGDLDKRLTFSYSISKDGAFIVQERVTPMTRDLMKKHKKDIRKMLTKLSKKLLLVDCKLDNFKNFGIRDNGDMCLLDHGDTVPLPNYQGNDIVNVNEESFVSLRCKKPEEMGVDKKHLKPCNGKLKYNKNFDYLICEECGGICSVNDAYREFYGDKSIKIKGGSCLDLDDSFDPDEWKAHIQKYCIETMSHADNNKYINNEGDETTMKTKIIENRNCVQVKGFWLPEPTGEFADYGIMYTAVKMGSTKPQKYLDKLGLNHDDYKVYPSEHTPSEKTKKKVKSERLAEEYGFDILEVRDKIVEKIISIGKFQTQITYAECAKLAPEVDFSNMRNIQGIREAVSSDKRTAGCIYNEEGFSVRLSDRYIVTDQEYVYNETNKDKTVVNKVTEIIEEKESDENIHDIKEPIISGYVHVVNEDDNEEDIDDIEFVTTTSSDNIDYIDSNNLAKEYASNNDTTIVEDLEEDYQEERSELIFSYDELEECAIDYNGVKCVVINKYAVPVDIIYRYQNNEGFYELPSSKMKALLKANGLQPKKYKVTRTESVEDTELETLSETFDPMDNMVKYSPGENEEDSVTFMSELNELAEKYANEHQDKIDKFGNIDIPVAEIIVECLLNHADNGESVEALIDVCHIEYDEEGNISISTDYKNISALYKMICNAKGSGVDISCDYMNATIGITLDRYIPKNKTDDEKYAEHIESVIKSCKVDGNLDLSSESIPVIFLEAPSYFNEEISDSTNVKHDTFDTVIEYLDEIYTSFYESYDDHDLISLDDFDEDEEIDELDLHYINICNEYKRIKTEIFENCKTLKEFYSYMDSSVFGKLIIVAHAMNRSVSMEDLEDVYNVLKGYTNEFMGYIESDYSNDELGDENSYNFESADKEIENDAEELFDLNSYIEDNNINNNEVCTTNQQDELDKDEHDNSEKEEEVLTQKVLDALIVLTEAINTNNERMLKQNELTTIKLDSLNEKLNTISDIVTPKFIPETISELVDTSNDLINKINNSSDDIVMLSEEDINKKIIAVKVNNTTVCFDILDLTKKATSETDAEYLSVTGINVSNL